MPAVKVGGPLEISSPSATKTSSLATVVVPVGPTVAFAPAVVLVLVAVWSTGEVAKPLTWKALA